MITMIVGILKPKFTIANREWNHILSLRRKKPSLMWMIITSVTFNNQKMTMCLTCLNGNLENHFLKIIRIRKHS